jgi:hypothetical protein
MQSDIEKNTRNKSSPVQALPWSNLSGFTAGVGGTNGDRALGVLAEPNIGPAQTSATVPSSQGVTPLHQARRRSMVAATSPADQHPCIIDFAGGAASDLRRLR